VATVAFCTSTRSRFWQWQLPVDKFWITGEPRAKIRNGRNCHSGKFNQSAWAWTWGQEEWWPLEAEAFHQSIYLPTQLVEGPLGSIIIQFALFSASVYLVYLPIEWVWQEESSWRAFCFRSAAKTRLFAFLRFPIEMINGGQLCSCRTPH